MLETWQLVNDLSTALFTHPRSLESLQPHHQMYSEWVPVTMATPVRSPSLSLHHLSIVVHETDLKDAACMQHIVARISVSRVKIGASQGY